MTARLQLTMLAVLLFILSLGAALGDPFLLHAEEVPHIVVLGDPHIPGRYQAEKNRTIDSINGWDDVSLVVAVGDITEVLGTEHEYTEARKFFARLAKPFIPVPGNHDYIYADTLTQSGKKKKAGAYVRERKLDLFLKTFGLPERYFTRTAGTYLLVFLATDDLHETLLAKLSDQQFRWLEATLKSNRKTPTIIFFHAPLKGTLRNYNGKANTENYIAQPHDRIDSLLKANRQVMLWVSGHTHTPPGEESFASALNQIGQVTNIHTPDMNRKTIWTNSLHLRADRIVVRTFNHSTGGWVPELERIIQTPDVR